jgi:predicted polyphosphate/ATP-dependent NAD kinase
MKTIGFLINPIAGMGGAVGLKGTDGKRIYEQALKLGAKAISSSKARFFLHQFRDLTDSFKFIVGAGSMGEDVLNTLNFDFEVIGDRKEVTNSEDTKNFARLIKELNIDLFVFCGGDGTARDIMDIIDTNIPVLGIPTGVKMHSGVFTLDPKAATRIVRRFLSEDLPLREVEIMDIDEQEYRNGRLSSRLYGHMIVPYEPSLIQGSKMASPRTHTELRSQAAIALYMIENMKKDIIYIMGPGTTVRTILDLVNEKKTLLGVDLLRNKKVIAADVNERRILDEIQNEKTKILVTPIGGQGFIFGRGNLQISKSVISKVGRDNIIVIATKNKLRALRNEYLRVDTGDPDFDETLRGYIDVIIDYNQKTRILIE